MTRAKEYLFDWPKEGQHVPTKFVLASDYAALRARVEALEQALKACIRIIERVWSPKEMLAGEQPLAVEIPIVLERSQQALAQREERPQ